MRQDARRTEWITIIAAGIVLGLALGHRNANGLYQLPIAGALDISRERFSFAIALQNLLWGLFMPFTGWLADRFNTAWVLFGGIVLYVAGLSLAAYATTSLALTLTMGVLVGIAMAGTTWIVNGAVSRVVQPARRPVALGMTGSIGATMQFIMLPLVALAIARLGWQGALFATAALFLFALPLLVPLRTEPVPATPQANAFARVGFRDVLSSRNLWFIWLGFTSCGFHLAFIAVHLPAYLADRGLDGSVAASALAVIALFNIAGTYAFGILGQRFRKRTVLASLYAVRTLAIVIYVSMPPTAVSTLLFAAIMGFLWLATAPLTNSLVGALFGIGSLSTLFGWVFLGHQIGGFLGVWLGGIVFDATGSYTIVWVIAVAIGIVSAIANLFIDEPRAGARPATAMP